MKIGQKVVHKRYGKATIVNVFNKAKNFRGGVLLKLDTDKGLQLFNNDRDMIGRYRTPIILKRCFESNLKALDKV